MGIADDLLASPGLDVGKDTVVGTDLVGAARIVVSALPGRIRHAWWYGSPGDELEERDVAELEM